MLQECSRPARSCRAENALAQQIYALIRSFVPNNPSKLLKGYSGLSISTLYDYNGPYRFGIKRHQARFTRTPLAQKIQPVDFISVIRAFAVARYSLFPTPYSLPP
jgi:hypothetical protein